MKTSDIKFGKGKVNGQPAIFIKIVNTDKSLGNVLYILGFEQHGEHYIKPVDESTWNGVGHMARQWIKERIYNATENRITCTALEAEFGLLANPQEQMKWIDNIKDVDLLNRCMNIL